MRHQWILGSTREAREQLRTAMTLPTPLAPVLDAHRRLRGPYTAAGALLRAIAPEAMTTCPDLLARHDVEILSMAPELASIVVASHETLTSLAIPRERTRFYSKLRTLRLAHGLTEFLQEYVSTGEPRAVLVENLHEADHTDLELFAVMLRRLDPGRVRLVLASATSPVLEPLPAAMTNCSVIRAEPAAVSGKIAATPAESDPTTRRLANQYVQSDCTSDQPKQIAAYDALAAAERVRLHDRRAEELRRRDEPSLLLGAIPFHLEHGSSPQKAARALIQAGDRCRSLGFYHATIELAERARRIVSWQQPWDRFEATAQMTSSLAALERGPEAEALYDEIRRSTTDPELHMRAAYATGMLYTRHHDDVRKNNDTARAWVNQAVAIASILPDEANRRFQSVFMNNGLALVEVHARNLPEALGLVSEGIEITDRELASQEHRLHRSVLRFNRGQVYAAMGRLQEAVAEYTAVIEVDPNFAEYYIDRGNLLRELGREEAALADYETVLQVSPPFTEAYYNRADVRLKAGDAAGALADFSYVLELDPEFVDAYVSRAGLRLADGDLDGTLLDARAGLSRDPQNPYLLTTLAQVHAEQGDVEAAAAAFDQAVASGTALAPVWCARAGFRYQSGDHAGALADLDEAVRRAPDDSTALYNRAVVYRELGRRSEAAVDLRAAAALAPDDLDIAQALAELPVAGAVAGLGVGAGA